ncbi:MAG: CehA/McbA family metallohydrolase [Clostridiales bacterium]|nr:CehA/McbA family metallohydrolase [Clostridiales bacterium]
MYTDLLGKKRMKLNLHTHTNRSDGHRTPEEAAAIYREAGYDLIALTDHWVLSKEEEISGLRTIAGCEYNIGGNDTKNGVFHIVGLGLEKEPAISPEADAQTVIDQINEAGGIAVLAHPAWSLNSVEQVKPLRGLAATEIFNTVSGLFQSDRAYSGTIVDLLANTGVILPLIAADDTHYYEGEQTVSSIMLDVTDGKTETKDILQKIKNGDFYATQGPEIHIAKEGDAIKLCCSPVQKISFFSDDSWHPARIIRGDNLTEAIHKPKDFSAWIRAEVTDQDGKMAFSNIIRLT